MITFHAEISGICVVGIRMGHDCFCPSDDTMDLFHIPSFMFQCTFSSLLMHALYFLLRWSTGKITKFIRPYNNSINLITPRFLFMLFSLRAEILVDVYSLLCIPDPVPPSLRKRLLRSHCGVYLHATSNSGDICELSIVYSTRRWLYILPGSRLCHSFANELDFENRSPTFRCKLSGTLSFLIKSVRLDVGIATTTLCAGKCLAVTHSLPGSKIIAHYIQHHHDAECAMGKIF